MKFLLSLCLTMAGLLPQAQAAPVTVTYVISFSDSYGTAVTNWDHNLVLPYFNGSLGSLIGAKFSYAASVTSVFGIENRDRRNPQSITATASANVTFDVPVLSTLSLSNIGSPTLLARYDNVLDFSGTSGSTQTLTAIDSNFYHISAPATLVSLTGIGNFLVPVHARALSSISGSGNLASSVSTAASASMAVTYTYNRTVPEPGALLLSMTALAVIGAGRLQRRSCGRRAH